MLRHLFRSKLHRATVTATNLSYQGSLTIDQSLLQAAEISEFEQIQVLNLNNGERFWTYAISGPAGSGCIEVNGAAARQAQAGDLLIVISYGLYEPGELAGHQPVVVQLNPQNQPL